MLTHKEREEYIAAEGARCPYCQSENTYGERPQVDGPLASAEVLCLACDKAWLDIYMLTDVIGVD